MEPVPDTVTTAFDPATASRGIARAFGYAVMAGAVVAAEFLIAVEAMVHRTLPVPWR